MTAWPPNNSPVNCETVQKPGGKKTEIKLNLTLMALVITAVVCFISSKKEKPFLNKYKDSR